MGIRRLTGAVVAVLAVGGLATAAQLASSSAVGAPTRSAVGTVFPDTLQPGGTTRFCGAGFAAGSAVAVSVGGTSATTAVAAPDGRFCVALQARDTAAGASRLVASGRDSDGRLLNVNGGVAVTRTTPYVGSAPPRSAVGPLVSDSRPAVLEAWGAVGVLALAAGACAIASQRRRGIPPERVASGATARPVVAAE